MTDARREAHGSLGIATSGLDIVSARASSGARYGHPPDCIPGSEFWPGGNRARGANPSCRRGRRLDPGVLNGLPDHRSVDGADYQLSCSAIPNQGRPSRYEDSPEGGVGHRRPGGQRRRPSVRRRSVGTDSASPVPQSRTARLIAPRSGSSCPPPRHLRDQLDTPQRGGPLTTSTDGEPPRHVIRSTTRGKPWDVHIEGRWA